MKEIHFDNQAFQGMVCHIVDRPGLAVRVCFYVTAVRVVDEKPDGLEERLLAAVDAATKACADYAREQLTTPPRVKVDEEGNL